MTRHTANATAALVTVATAPDDGLNASRGVFNGLVVGLAMQVFAVAAWLLLVPGATP